MLQKSDTDCEFAVVGAGPYGLAVASHLRAAGRDARIFGKVMDFWENQMPKGMCLRSPKTGSDISDPSRAFTLNRFEAAENCHVPSSRMPLEQFVSYGKWFQRQSLPDLDSRLVNNIERVGGGFDLRLDDDEHVASRNVVIATGIGAFPNYPAGFSSLPLELVSHASERVNRDLGRFSGRRVVVIGAGQSALESAALLSESGAQVEILARQPRVRWLRSSSWLEWLMDCKLNPFKVPGKIGPIGINWLVENPRLFTAFPRRLQDKMTTRAIRPAGSSWLRPRTTDVTFQTGRHVVSATRQGDRVRLELNDGSHRDADHVLLGTGYKVSVSRIKFLSADLRTEVRSANGYPVLNWGLESTVPGLHFVGATGAHSFGPLCRFVAGTSYTASALTAFVRKKSRSRSFANA